MSLFNTTAMPSDPNAVPDIWEKIIYQLNGSCDSLEQALANNEAEELEDHMPFLNYMDNEIFCCECCNWWCPISEMNEQGDWECRDCVPEDDE